jgi:hypothetical protein
MVWVQRSIGDVRRRAVLFLVLSQLTEPIREGKSQGGWLPKPKWYLLSHPR